jgi:hypothetical protein
MYMCWDGGLWLSESLEDKVQVSVATELQSLAVKTCGLVDGCAWRSYPHADGSIRISSAGSQSHGHGVALGAVPSTSGRK